MNDLAIIPQAQADLASPRPTLSAEQEIEALWLHDKSPRTQRYYREEIRRFSQFINALRSQRPGGPAARPGEIPPLPTVMLAELQRYADWLATLGLCEGSQKRAIAVVKSFFKYAGKIEYLKFNPAAMLKMPNSKDTLNERILSEAEVRRIIDAARPGRDRVLVELLYIAGLRIAEATEATWADLCPRDDGGQITVLGKGRKTRTLLLPAGLWGRINSLPGGRPAVNGRIFPICQCQAWRIMRAAASRAGLAKPVSPHWLRHGFASHSLDRGAPLHLVQRDMGHANIATTGRYLHARPDDGCSKYLPKID